MELPSVAPLPSEPQLPTSEGSPDKPPERLSTVAPLLPTAPRRALCFDLENRPLAYWYDGATTSEITAFGWKWADEASVRTLVLRRNGRYETDDGKSVVYKEAHRLFGDELAQAGLVFGHNIRRHDLPMLQAWRIRLFLPPLKAMLTTDTCRDLPKRNGMSYSLETLSAHYDLGNKKAMPQPAWEKANQLDPAGVREARWRVRSDVLLQERLRARLAEDGLLSAPRSWKP